MFYTDDPNKVLRFGDVTSGFISSIPQLKAPLTANQHPEYKLELSAPKYCAVLSPCCSVGEGTLSLAPLQPLTGNFFKNPYFVENLERINQLVEPERAYAPADWDALPEETRRQRLESGKDYAFKEYFIYSEHDMIQPKYQVVHRKIVFETGSYAIDFRKMFRISCPLIRDSNDAVADQQLLDSKILQLSVDAREDLRQKLAYYFQRRPDEDAASTERAVAKFLAPSLSAASALLHEIDDRP